MKDEKRKSDYVSKEKIKDRIRELGIKYNERVNLQLADYNEWIRYTAKVTELNRLLEEE